MQTLIGSAAVGEPPRLTPGTAMMSATCAPLGASGSAGVEDPPTARGRADLDERGDVSPWCPDPGRLGVKAPGRSWRSLGRRERLIRFPERSRNFLNDHPIAEPVRKVPLVGNRRIVRRVEAAMTNPKSTAPARQRSAAGGDLPRLLTRGEVARLFRVDPTTVTRRADTGRLTVIRTLGATRHYRSDEVLAALPAT
jgi:hypothetical protein